MTEPAFLSATRTAYDTVAVDYARLVATELDTKPLDRALLATFAELVLADGAGPVADLGCGPGRITVHLQALGLAAFGVDLSREWSPRRDAATRACGSSRGRSPRWTSPTAGSAVPSRGTP